MGLLLLLFKNAGDHSATGPHPQLRACSFSAGLLELSSLVEAEDYTETIPDVVHTGQAKVATAAYPVFLPVSSWTFTWILLQVCMFQGP